ncbi:MAG: hypothetical protein KGN77_02095 [Xanthomonadaceae bacterium]|nr:hypothetical protein [Xanthomonadaceae bacterium]
MELRRQGVRDPEAVIVRAILISEADELAAFASEHLASHSYALPHVAARATIQR